MRLKRTISLVLISFFLWTFLPVSVPTAKASTPVIDNESHVNCADGNVTGSSGCKTLHLTMTFTQGDMPLVIVVFFDNAFNSGISPSLTVSDGGDTFTPDKTEVIGSCVSCSQSLAEIGRFPPVQAGALTITMTVNTGGANHKTQNASRLQVFSVAIQSLDLVVGTAKQASAGDKLNCLSCNADDFMFSGMAINSQGPIGSCITAFHSNPTDCQRAKSNVGAGGGTGFAASGVQVATSNCTTNCNWASISGTANFYYAYFYAEYTFAPGGILVIPCTFFQQQCWWYPSLFFALYLGLFMLVAAKGEVEGNSRTYLALSALNTASMAQTAMGLLTPVVPLLLITLTVVYAVRFRNR